MTRAFYIYWLTVGILTQFLIQSLYSANSFEPAKYIPKQDKNFILFLETNSIEQTIANLRKFYFSLRRKQVNKEVEWNFLTKLLTSGFGFNPFNEARLKKLGVDPKGKIGVAIYGLNSASLKKKIHPAFGPHAKL